MSAVSKEDLRQVQKAAYLAITNLNSADSLGPGMCTRYILPAILCLVGVPQLLVSACARKSSKLDSPPTSPTDSVSVDGNSSVSVIYDPQEMFVVRTIIELSQYIGIDSCADIILKKIFNEVLPNLVQSVSLSLSISTSGSFMEVFFLLNGLLASLSQEFVKLYYLRPQEASKISLCSLVTLFPHLKDSDEDVTTSEKCDENARRQLVQVELYRLLITTCMYVGPEYTIEWVLPQIDEFFKTFVDAYGGRSLDRKDFHRSLEMAAELVVPLIQLVEAEAFYTAVPHLNPRLEMWLLSKSAGEQCTSPPLPVSILPAAPSSDAPNTPKSGKGFMSWLSGLGSKSANKSSATKEYERNKKKGSIPPEDSIVDIPLAPIPHPKPKLAAEQYSSTPQSSLKPESTSLQADIIDRPALLPDEGREIMEEIAKLSFATESITKETELIDTIEVAFEIPAVPLESPREVDRFIEENLVTDGPSKFYSTIFLSGAQSAKVTNTVGRKSLIRLLLIKYPQLFKLFFLSIFTYSPPSIYKAIRCPRWRE